MNTQIEIQQTTKKVTFGSLEEGDLFLDFDGDLGVKILGYEQGNYIYLAETGGYFFRMSDDVKVTPVAKIIVVLGESE